jgi:hypothetical protein
VARNSSQHFEDVGRYAGNLPRYVFTQAKVALFHDILKHQAMLAYAGLDDELYGLVTIPPDTNK